MHPSNTTQVDVRSLRKSRRLFCEQRFRIKLFRYQDLDECVTNNTRVTTVRGVGLRFVYMVICQTSHAAATSDQGEPEGCESGDCTTVPTIDVVAF